MSVTPIIPGLQRGRLLGQGSLCDVWEARWNDRRIAVKVLRAENEYDDGLVATLRNELAVGLAVKHHNIVRVRGGSVLRPPYHLIMDRVPGYTLRQILDRDGVLPAWLMIEVLRQAALALGALHHAGYVHGDVKPANLMLDTEGHVTLIDLGFARQPGSRPHGEGILGTPNYLAPELCHRAFVDTPAADIFALGITAFELLTGELPYPAMDETEAVLLAHRDTAPTTLRNRRGVWPRELATLIDAMLKVELFQRPKAMAIANQLLKWDRSRRIAA